MEKQYDDIKNVGDNVGGLKMENEHKQLFDTINHFETNYGVDFSSFDFMPALFNGLQTSSFGYSSNKKKNPFFKLAEISKDKSLSWEDRTQAIRYMQRIPHINRSEYCIDCSIELILDDTFPLRNRYHFFSNNEKIIKLDYDIVNACHHYYFLNPDKFNGPLVYRILSAQYLLTQFPIRTYDDESVQQFLYDIATDKENEVHYRAECADILSRVGYDKYREMGDKVLTELGTSLTVDKDKLFTIYSNAQNVHDPTITKKILEGLQYLVATVVPKCHSGEVFEILKDRLKDTKYDSIRDKTIESFQRVIIDTSRYEGLNMCEIMLFVWEKIIHSPNKEELIDRFIEELSEMNNSCSSGHITRLLNVLSGFFEDIKPVQISYEEQLKSNVFGRYTNVLRTLDEKMRDDVLREMSEDNKPTCDEVIFSYSPKEELYEEFVGGEYMTSETFEKCYNKAEKDFFGYKKD